MMNIRGKIAVSQCHSVRVKSIFSQLATLTKYKAPAERILELFFFGQQT